MRKSVEAEGMTRLILILNMVHILANSKETAKIASGLATYHANKDDTDRINKVYHYILSPTTAMKLR